MARPSKDKLAKRQKEIERKKKADEKMARRHEKKNKPPAEGITIYFTCIEKETP